MIGRAGSVWSAPPASPAPPRRVWRDWVLVAVVPLLVIVEGFARTDVPAVVPAVVVVIALVPTLLWRRTHPLPMLVITSGVSGLFRLVTGAEIELFTSGFLLLVIYSVFRWGSGRAIVIGLAILLASTAASTLPPPFVLEDLVGGLAFLAVTILLALLVRARAGSRMRELDRVKALERDELARDLHDTVAHHVSAIAVQAQAGLATVATNPDAASAALRVIEAEASRTLAEMRVMVRALRTDDVAALAPTRTISELARPATADGPLVDVQVAGDVAGVPAPVAAALFRIAQESVTNARRHARGVTRIDVRLEVDDARARLTVRDDGAPGPSGAPGYGITGMTERALLLGGTCTASRGPDGGWMVTADLPSGGAA